MSSRAMTSLETSSFQTSPLQGSALAAPLAGDDPYVDVVISYNAGLFASPGYTNPNAVIGSPERFTGEGIFPGAVTAFNQAWGSDEILSIGLGGSLVVKFNTPVTDDPNNPYGIDLIIFGNTSFEDAHYDNGIVGGVFGDDGGTIEVSADGEHWVTVPDLVADGPMPTIGYLDAGPYATRPGTLLSNFTRPVDPALTVGDFLGLNNFQLISLYRGSGGGVGVDLAHTGLAQISYVRITNPRDNFEAIEFDAMSDVSPRIPGDVNYDGLVDIDDLLALIGAWGPSVPGGVPADFDNNHIVNIDDLLTLIAHWTTQP
jgi:hypothetical protein